MTGMATFGCLCCVWLYLVVLDVDGVAFFPGVVGCW